MLPLLVILTFALIGVTLRYSYLVGQITEIRTTALTEIEDQNARIKLLADANIQLMNENAAWTQGIEEQKECYEQDFLTFNENLVGKNITIERLRESLRNADALNRVHTKFCLPIMDIDSFVAIELSTMGPDYDIEALLDDDDLLPTVIHRWDGERKE